MARLLIRQAHGGESATISDRALPFFLSQNWVVIDTLDDETDPSPLYLSTVESDLRYANLGDIADPTSATGSELRTFLEPKIDRSGADAGDVPVLQADGSLAFGAGGGGAVSSVAGKTGAVTLTPTDVGVPNATTVAAGMVQLTNGLTGTYDKPDVVGAPWIVEHDGVTDPVRPSTARQVWWIVPNANRPATNGVTTGGSYAAVDNLDKIFTF